ncbi:MAG: hypothetical protein KDC12_06885, partial [Flavobacteriales bacterium]|nr:hypothetical protein [Flavobacteriales bacterium]
MQRIAQMWKWIRLVVILTAGASVALWFTEDHAFSTGGIIGFGFLFLGWVLLYLAAQRVMVRLYCPFRKVQSL